MQLWQTLDRDAEKRNRDRRGRTRDTFGERKTCISGKKGFTIDIILEIIGSFFKESNCEGKGQRDLAELRQSIVASIRVRFAIRKKQQHAHRRHEGYKDL